MSDYDRLLRIEEITGNQSCWYCISNIATRWFISHCGFPVGYSKKSIIGTCEQCTRFVNNRNYRELTADEIWVFQLMVS